MRKVFIAIGMARGIIERSTVFELKENAEKESLRFSMLDGYDFADYDRMIQWSLEGDNEGYEWFVLETTQGENEYDAYPYKYKGVYYGLYRMQAMLMFYGHHVVENMDELEFSQYLYDRQHDRLQAPAIQFLEERYHLSYKDGEKSKVVYAKTEDIAKELACEWDEHPESWEIYDA